MERIDGAFAFDGEQPLGDAIHVFFGVAKLGMVRVDILELVRREIVADRVRNHEVSVGKPCISALAPRRFAP